MGKSEHTDQTERIPEMTSSVAEESPRQARKTAIWARLKKVSGQQKITSGCDALPDFASYAVAEAYQQRTNLDKRRLARPPFKRAGNTLQKFMSTLSLFIEAYNGVNGIARGIDCQYGDLVVSALSVLAQIGKNKEGREMAINSILEELTKSWMGEPGRLCLYSDAYPSSSRMEGFLADVYLAIGELAVESAEYYSRPPYTRFWQAIRRPPKLGIDVKADEIKRAIFEVVSEANAYFLRDFADHRRAWETLCAQQTKNQLAHISRELGISRELADADRMIAQCKALHAHAFAEAYRKKRSKQLQQISINVLKDKGLCTTLEQSAPSAVLVLSGSNYDIYDSGAGLCWLSPITTEIAESYQAGQSSQGTSKILFHSACADRASRFSNEKEPFDLCLSRFILQILLWDDGYFSQTRQTVEDDIRDNNCHRLETLQSLLKGWTRSDEICIIIDRLDCIALHDNGRNSSDDEISELLETVLNIVSAASCNIKLVVTVDTKGWPLMRENADLDRRWKIWKQRIDLQRYSLLRKVCWHQPELHEY
ncbi:MAG: hypothetical protein Q9222_004845 [Ikaeria aurantiellina]